MNVSQRSRQPLREPWTLDRLQRKRSIALGLAIDDSTFKTYSSALNSYINFCRLHRMDVDPTEDTLSFYTVYMSHHIKPSSVDSYLSGILSQLEPYFPHIRAVRASLLVRRTLKGCKRLKGTPTNRKQALTLPMLQTLLRRWGTSVNHDDLLFVAIVLTGFHVLMRLGELTWPEDKSLRNWDKVTKCASVQWHDKAFEIFLPSHKADQFFEGNRVIVQQNNLPTDPHTRFLKYLRSRNSHFPIHPALWLRADGSIPTRTFVTRRFALVFDKSISGQSLRSGGATSLAEAGVPPHIIQGVGRWKSEAFQIYIRKNPVLLQALIFGGRSIHQPPALELPL